MPLLARRWWICGLLLLATMVNYMDRLALNLSKVAISADLHLTNEQYGGLESWFGYAFAFGSLVFGYAAERWSVRWLYPVILGGWSLAAAACAWTHSYEQLLLCRIVFGMFEAGHWPCAVKTTFASLASDERTLGNSILQSGASVAAIAMPQLMKLITSESDVTSWRGAFMIVGFAGLGWVLMWGLIVRRSDVTIKAPDNATSKPMEPIWPVLKSGPFWAVALLIVGAQTAWQLPRVWLPSFLEEGRHYAHGDVLNFTSLYYLCTDIGCLAAGGVSLWLVRRWRMTAHLAKRRVYLVCALMTCGSLAIPWLSHGNLLLSMILFIGAGALGLFPCYYGFVQELSPTNVARVTGIMSFWVWIVTSPMHSAFGHLVDQTKSFDLGMACAGLAPLLGVAALALLWPVKEARASAC